MNTFFPNNRIKLIIQSIMSAVMFGLSAHAALYTFNYGDSGAIPQGGTTFSAEHTVSIADYSITSIELILTFNDSRSLSGNSTGLQGLLTLGTGSGSPFASFYPTATSSSGAQRIYDMTFSEFNALNPNDTWSLNLWDNSTSGFGNGLVSWTLDITAVPEPVNVALGVFGVVMAGTVFVRQYLGKNKVISV